MIGNHHVFGHDDALAVIDDRDSVTSGDDSASSSDTTSDGDAEVCL